MLADFCHRFICNEPKMIFSAELLDKYQIFFDQREKSGNKHVAITESDVKPLMEKFKVKRNRKF